MIEGAEHQQGKISEYRKKHDDFLRHALFLSRSHLLAPLKERRLRELQKPDDVPICVFYRCNQLPSTDIFNLLQCVCASVSQ